MDPFQSYSSFPYSKDKFPSLIDAGSAESYSLDSSFTKVNASHFNRLADFIGKAQPTIVTATTSVSGDGTLSGLTWTYKFSPVSLKNLPDLLTNKSLYSLSPNLMPPTQALPFEFVLTTDGYDFSNAPNNSISRDRDDRRMQQKENPTALSNSMLGKDIFTSSIFATVTLSKGGFYTSSDQSFLNKFIVNSYVMSFEKTIIVRGSVFSSDVAAYGLESDVYPLKDNWPEDTFLNCTIFGALT